MDIRTGNIYPFDDTVPDDAVGGRLMEMLVPPTEEQLARTPPRVGRNEPCPCGSGKKFKRCHYSGDTPEASK